MSLLDVDGPVAVERCSDDVTVVDERKIDQLQVINDIDQYKIDVTALATGI